MNEINVGDRVDLDKLPITLDFDSEFEAFGGVDPDKFGHVYPWGNETPINDEAQGYPADPMNLPSSHKPLFMRDGALVMRCAPTCWMDAEAVQGRPYTSALLSTEGKFSFYQGVITVNAKLPAGKLAFPCPLWSLIEGWADNPRWRAIGKYEGMPNPEWDIIEILGHTGKVLYQTVHSNMNLKLLGSDKESQAQKQLIEPVEGGTDYTEGFHEFTGIWDDYWLYWLIDGVCTFRFPVPLDFIHGDKVRRFLLSNLAFDSGWSRSQPQYDLKYAPDGKAFPDAAMPVEMELRHIKAYRWNNTEAFGVKP